LITLGDGTGLGGHAFVGEKYAECISSWFADSAILVIEALHPLMVASPIADAVEDKAADPDAKLRPLRVVLVDLRYRLLDSVGDNVLAVGVAEV